MGVELVLAEKVVGEHHTIVSYKQNTVLIYSCFLPEVTLEKGTSSQTSAESRKCTL
jgi:hypothetical protein